MVTHSSGYCLAQARAPSVSPIRAYPADDTEERAAAFRAQPTCDSGQQPLLVVLTNEVGYVEQHISVPAKH